METIELRVETCTNVSDTKYDFIYCINPTSNLLYIGDETYNNCNMALSL